MRGGAGAALDKRLDNALAAGAVSLPTWRWPEPKPYNGFTGAERIRGWQRTWAAVAAGILPKPHRCSICGTEQGRIELHTENYTRPLEAKPVCRACHRSLHRRFQDPDQWHRRVKQFGDGTKWFEQIAKTNTQAETNG